jgi:Amt family ammonium transporter
MTDFDVESFDLAQFCESNAADSASSAAICEVSASVDAITTGLDTFFLLFAGALVFLMQSGFAMLCAGSVRQKNVKNILLKNLLDACGGAIGFYTLGFGFAYGATKNGGTSFIGTSNFALVDYENGAGGGADYIGFFFQFAFAPTAATIVAGTVAERCKMAGYLCYSIFLTAFVYPVVVHSIWSSDGFLSAFNSYEGYPWRGVGMIDFAGSGVVHMTGGATALIAAVVLGPRRGRFYDEDGNVLETPVSFPAHSTALQVLGTFVLWFGWYGFNPGSALMIGNPASAATAALCAVTTTLAAATGCVTAMFFDSIMDHRVTGEVAYDLTMAMNGALAGLVAITAGCSVVSPWASIIIGAVAGLVYYGFSKLLIKLRIDDAVDAVPVHFANGMWGVFSVGLFSQADLQVIAGFSDADQGVFMGGKGDLLLCQVCGILWICGWVCVLMTPFFLAINAIGIFRVDSLEEEVGLDISHHKGAAYDLTSAKQQDVEELMEIRASRHGKIDVPKPVESEELAGE